MAVWVFWQGSQTFGLFFLLPIKKKKSMSILSAYMCVHHRCAKERKALNTLRLELQTFVATIYALGTEFRSCRRAASVFNCWVSFPASAPAGFRKPVSVTHNLCFDRFSSEPQKVETVHLECMCSECCHLSSDSLTGPKTSPTYIHTEGKGDCLQHTIQCLICGHPLFQPKGLSALQCRLWFPIRGMF